MNNNELHRTISDIHHNYCINKHATTEGSFPASVSPIQEEIINLQALMESLNNQLSLLENKIEPILICRKYFTESECENPCIVNKASSTPELDKQSEIKESLFNYNLNLKQIIDHVTEIIKRVQT